MIPRLGGKRDGETDRQTEEQQMQSTGEGRSQTKQDQTDFKAFSTLDTAMKTCAMPPDRNLGVHVPHSWWKTLSSISPRAVVWGLKRDNPDVDLKLPTQIAKNIQRWTLYLYSGEWAHRDRCEFMCSSGVIGSSVLQFLTYTQPRAFQGSMGWTGSWVPALSAKVLELTYIMGWNSFNLLFSFYFYLEMSYLLSSSVFLPSTYFSFYFLSLMCYLPVLLNLFPFHSYT